MVDGGTRSRVGPLGGPGAAGTRTPGSGVASASTNAMTFARSAGKVGGCASVGTSGAGNGTTRARLCCYRGYGEGHASDGPAVPRVPRARRGAERPSSRGRHRRERRTRRETTRDDREIRGAEIQQRPARRPGGGRYRSLPATAPFARATPPARARAIPSRPRSLAPSTRALAPPPVRCSPPRARRAAPRARAPAGAAGLRARLAARALRRRVRRAPGHIEGWANEFGDEYESIDADDEWFEPRAARRDGAPRPGAPPRGRAFDDRANRGGGRRRRGPPAARGDDWSVRAPSASHRARRAGDANARPSLSRRAAGPRGHRKPKPTTKITPAGSPGGERGSSSSLTPPRVVFFFAHLRACFFAHPSPSRALRPRSRSESFPAATARPRRRQAVATIRASRTPPRRVGVLRTARLRRLRPPARRRGGRSGGSWRGRPAPGATTTARRPPARGGDFARRVVPPAPGASRRQGEGPPSSACRGTSGCARGRPGRRGRAVFRERRGRERRRPAEVARMRWPPSPPRRERSTRRRGGVRRRSRGGSRAAGARGDHRRGRGGEGAAARTGIDVEGVRVSPGRHPGNPDAVAEAADGGARAGGGRRVWRGFDEREEGARVRAGRR